MVNTRNEDIAAKYFDLVQNEIKKLISEDKEIKPNEIEKFNNAIFDQPDEIKTQISNYIENASLNNLDIKKVAKIIYDKFKMQVKNNVFNQKDAQNVPNKLMGERKFIKTYEGFLNEYSQNVKPKWDIEAYKNLYNQLVDKEQIAVEYLEDLGNPRPKTYKELVDLLKDYDTDESLEMANDIIELVNMLDHFGVEMEIELSQLN